MKVLEYQGTDIDLKFWFIEQKQKGKTEEKNKYLKGALEVYIVIKAEYVKIPNMTRAEITESYISSQTGKVEEGILIFLLLSTSGPWWRNWMNESSWRIYISKNLWRTFGCIVMSNKRTSQ